MGGFSTEGATSFEMKVLKWIFLPLILSATLYSCIDASLGQHKCENLCVEKEFYGHRYISRYNRCYCLTEEDSGKSKWNSEAKRVF